MKVKHTFNAYNPKTGAIFQITLKRRQMGSSAFREMTFFDHLVKEMGDGAKELDDEIVAIEKKIFTQGRRPER